MGEPVVLASVSLDGVLQGAVRVRGGRQRADGSIAAGCGTPKRGSHEIKTKWPVVGDERIAMKEPGNDRRTPLRRADARLCRERHVRPRHAPHGRSNSSIQVTSCPTSSAESAAMVATMGWPSSSNAVRRFSIRPASPAKSAPGRGVRGCGRGLEMRYLVSVIDDNAGVATPEELAAAEDYHEGPRAGGTGCSLVASRRSTPPPSSTTGAGRASSPTGRSWSRRSTAPASGSSRRPT
jgi:hypothetical protein